MANQEEVPKVFISYSHDSHEHKKWVGELASKLVENGIDVILDQWDLGLGDDVPKFVENAVSEVDRVLMICTETYVKKADAGKGGVGYEAMIVTGELIRDLGTSKFIPVIRQKSEKSVLPKAVGTRFYINLSEGQNLDEQLETLLRELHQAPVAVKPPLGKNPFARQASGIEAPVRVEAEAPLPDIREYNKDASRVYQTALHIARQGDLVAWRRIVMQTKEPISRALQQWRQKYEPNPPSEIKVIQAAALEGISCYSALMSIALAGVESGRDIFSNQTALIDEILNPKDWNRSGYVRIVDLPKSVAFVYQALHGAVCLETNQVQLAIKFARTKVLPPMEGTSRSLYLLHDIMGWPESLGRNGRESYKFVTAMPCEWKWLLEIFGDADEYRKAICSYYMALNVLEFIDTVAEGKEGIFEKKDVSLDIPLYFLTEEDTEVTRRAYRLLISDPTAIKSLWRSLKVEDAAAKKYWPLWINLLKGWLWKANFRFDGQVAHEALITDLE